MQLEVPYRNAYPVDPRYAVNKETHLSQTFSRVMDKMFITHGNGDQLAIMLNELRADKYLDYEEEYFSQAIAAGINVAKSPPSFENAIGGRSPTGYQLRELKDRAAESALVSTGLSDKDRVRREMQSVGCSKGSSSDHTFEFIKNYAKGILPEKACGHTIGQDEGQIASIAIVSTTKQVDYAHQAEQCTLRKNWNPLVHTTDNCPVGIVLWRLLQKNVNMQLGLFHFQYRITKTLNKQCKGWRQAVQDLQECIYVYDEVDLQNVKNAILIGTAGRVNGKPCTTSETVAYAKAKSKAYQENVRIWTYEKVSIVSNLENWNCKYQEHARRCRRTFVL